MQPNWIFIANIATPALANEFAITAKRDMFQLDAHSIAARRAANGSKKKKKRHAWLTSRTENIL